VPDSWIDGTQNSPVYEMAMDWKVAFPLHPEYRTLPMVWYVPPLSPIKSAAEAGALGEEDEMPDVRSLRIPLKYLANLLTAGDEAPVALALERMLAMRAFLVELDEITEREADWTVFEEMALLFDEIGTAASEAA
jgi:nitrate reductase / nitrite oxidoreductase, beta subunit